MTEPQERVTVRTLLERKAGSQPISMCTAYDAGQARLVDEAGIDVILVGDSVANVCHGHETTIPVTLDEMIQHCRWVARGRKRALLVGDLPFLSYQTGVRDAMIAAGRLLKEGFVDAVKLEGGAPYAEAVRALVTAGIPVMGHLGLTPQSVHVFGGYRVQGRSASQAQAILEDALLLERCGAFALVLECVPGPLAAEISKRLTIPTIGIGAGAKVDGQVLVLHDLLGLSRGSAPRFVKRYASLGDEAIAALRAFHAEVIERRFPGPEHTYGMPAAELERLGIAAAAASAEPVRAGAPSEAGARERE